MHKAVDAAEVDEDAKIGNRLNRSFKDLPFFKAAQNCLALVGHLFFDENFVADDDIFRRMVYFHNAEIHFPSDQRVEIADRPNVDLRAGEKSVDPHKVNNDSAFDSAEAAAFEHLAAFE